MAATSSYGYHFANAIFGSKKNFLSPRVLISGYKKFGHVKMIERDSFSPSAVNSEDCHFPCSTGSRLGSIAGPFEIVRVAESNKEREAVPQDGLNDLRAAIVSADLVAEVAVGKGVNKRVHGLPGEQLVD